MIYEDRQYQLRAEDALLRDALKNNGTHPVIAIPTGGGKTKILSSFIYKYLELLPQHNVLVLSHTETILKQDYEALQHFFPGIYIGLYSAGLKSKTIEKITVAGIQSAYRKPELFSNTQLVVVDECHSVPPKGNGMYRTFLEWLENTSNCTRAGLSATVFRTGTGLVYRGRGALFNTLSYDLCTLEGFNKLVTDGYLTRLISKPPELQLDPTGISTSAGDYNQKELSESFDRHGITERAVAELLRYGKNYKSWLVFAIDTDHANHIHEELVKAGINAELLHTKTKHKVDRHELKERFVRGEVRAIVSVGMVTTGFDAPNIDLIVLLRPTKSPVLHIQMIGRGLRVTAGKDHCLVLDFAGNIARLGPINDVAIPTRKKKKKANAEPVVKECQECGCLHHPSVKVCDVCGYEFQFEESIDDTPTEAPVVKYNTEDKVKWLDVTAISYSVHTKKDAPTSLRVKYNCGLFTVSEYVCYNHSGYAKYKADNWVRFRWIRDIMPPNVEAIAEYNEFLKVPKRVLVDLSKKYPSILDAIF